MHKINRRKFFNTSTIMGAGAVVEALGKGKAAPGGVTGGRGAILRVNRC